MGPEVRRQGEAGGEEAEEGQVTERYAVVEVTPAMAFVTVARMVLEYTRREDEALGVDSETAERHLGHVSSLLLCLREELGLSEQALAVADDVLDERIVMAEPR